MSSCSSSIRALWRRLAEAGQRRGWRCISARALDGLELDVVGALAFNTPSGESARWGCGDTTLGVKYRVTPESEVVPLVSLVPKLTIPTGNSDRGLGNGGSQVFLVASAEKTYGSLQTYGNAGYWINNGADNRNYWFFGWQAQYQFSDACILGGTQSHADRDDCGGVPLRASRGIGTCRSRTTTGNAFVSNVSHARVNAQYGKPVRTCSSMRYWSALAAVSGKASRTRMGCVFLSPRNAS